MSFPDYFLQLLELLAIDWLRLPLLQGLATSAVAGAEGLIRASRLALVQCINGKKAEQRQAMVTMVVKNLSTILSDNLQDDRYAIPIMELLAFLIDGYIPFIPEDSESMSVADNSRTVPNRHTDMLSLAFEKYSSSSKKHTSNRPTYSASKLQSRSIHRCPDSRNYDRKFSRR